MGDSLVQVDGSLALAHVFLEHGVQHNLDRKVQMRAGAQELRCNYLELEVLLVLASNPKQSRAMQLRRIGLSLQKVVINFSEFFFL